MPSVRIAREASTGLTSNIGGTAANPTAGPNNWVAILNNMTRQSGGGMKGTNAGGFNVCTIDLGAICSKFIMVVADPAAAITESNSVGSQGIVEFGLTLWDDTVKYTFRPFSASGSNYITFLRQGAGSVGGDELFVDHSGLNSAVPWTFTVERTGVTTFTVAVTDGTTSAGPSTYTDTGDSSRPTGTVVSLIVRNSAFTITDLDLYGEGAAPQLAAPTSDVTSGWTPSTGASLFGVIDETVQDNSDYAYATAPSTMEVGFAALSDPGVSTGHKPKYAIYVASGQTLTVSLRQGATLIAQWVHTGPVGTSAAPVLFEQTLSGTEADAITSYADLRLRAVLS